ncbi:hypothetical protein ACSL103130_07990 [Actinomyces slackii]|uniref:DUF559 domain-containing protein n=1 Tax=Actinomyces slackii TaxID=52774 RepID=A0A448KAB0_9ACTO|nr:hypothetical protein [Actinomyces slackii]VEG73842.1 Uncharacterised protein [Actinomyces slackii]
MHANSVVALHDADPRVVLCRRIGGVMTCAHALRLYGLPAQEEPGALHVAVPAHRGRIPGDLGRTVIHRVAGQDASRMPVASIELALVCYMRCAEELDALIAVDAALHAGLVRLEELEGALPGPRNGPVRKLLARAHPQARSILETIARYELEEAGYAPFVAVYVEGVGEVDILLTAYPGDVVPGPRGALMLRPDAEPALIIETDGYAYHSSRVNWERDRMRDQASVTCGHITVRVSASQVRAHATVGIVAPIAARMGIEPIRDLRVR